jgi:hypothetical protein
MGLSMHCMSRHITCHTPLDRKPQHSCTQGENLLQRCCVSSLTWSLCADSCSCCKCSCHQHQLQANVQHDCSWTEQQVRFTVVSNILHYSCYALQ